MMLDVRRRDFIALLGGAAAAWPLAARAQQRSTPTIGYLDSGSSEPRRPLVVAFLLGLREAGFIENKSVAIEYRWADGEYGRLPALAAELVSRRVDVIVAMPGFAAQAAKDATRTIPIVFFSGPDPVRNGLVASLNRPGGNATGVTTMTSELAPKRLELLHELLPRATSFAFLVNASNPRAEPDVSDMQSAARAVGQHMIALRSNDLNEIDGAFGHFAQRGVGAVLVGADPFFRDVRIKLSEVAARHSLPAIFAEREYAKDGGLMSYGASQAVSVHLVGVYAGRVLRGAQPSDLPVQQPAKFELVVNLRTAKALGLTVPDTVLARADEVIE